MGLQAEGAVSIEQTVRVLQVHVVAGRAGLAVAALPAGEVGQIGQEWHSAEPQVMVLELMLYTREATYCREEALQ